MIGVVARAVSPRAVSAGVLLPSRAPTRDRKQSIRTSSRALRRCRCACIDSRLDVLSRAARSLVRSGFAVSVRPSRFSGWMDPRRRKLAE